MSDKKMLITHKRKKTTRSFTFQQVLKPLSQGYNNNTQKCQNINKLQEPQSVSKNTSDYVKCQTIFQKN